MSHRIFRFASSDSFLFALSAPTVRSGNVPPWPAPAQVTVQCTVLRFVGFGSLRVIESDPEDDAEDFAASVERDLARLPTIEETDRR